MKVVVMLTVHSSFCVLYEGHSISVIQNGTILLIFKI